MEENRPVNVNKFTPGSYVESSNLKTSEGQLSEDALAFLKDKDHLKHLFKLQDQYKLQASDGEGGNIKVENNVFAQNLDGEGTPNWKN